MVSGTLIVEPQVVPKVSTFRPLNVSTFALKPKKMGLKGQSPVDLTKLAAVNCPCDNPVDMVYL
jgi:hypothetical protein